MAVGADGRRLWSDASVCVNIIVVVVKATAAAASTAFRAVCIAIKRTRKIALLFQHISLRDYTQGKLTSQNLYIG